LVHNFIIEYANHWASKRHERGIVTHRS